VVAVVLVVLILFFLQFLSAVLPSLWSSLSSSPCVGSYGF
jgi:hypothetical protein